MKKIVILIAVSLLLQLGTLLRADLVEAYKTGTVSLEIDSQFGKNTDWGKLFYYKMRRSEKILKTLTFSDDGSIFVSNYMQSNLYKFDSQGNFIKEVAGKGRKTSANSPLNRRPGTVSVLDNKYLVVPEYQGRIGIFDLQGKQVKIMTMKYGVFDCIALGNNKIAVLGSVVMGGGGIKNLLAIKDIETEKEIHVTSSIYDIRKESVRMKKGRGLISVGGPFSKGSTFIRRTPEGNVIFCQPVTPLFRIFSPDGKEIRRFNGTFKRIKVTEKEKQEYKDGVNKSTKNKELARRVVEAVDKNADFFPDYTPYYYQVMIDSDGNILVFIYTEKKGLHRFQVYSPEGKYICETTLEPGNLEVRINKRLKTMTFYKGNLYGVFLTKDAPGKPFRLFKMKLKGK